MAKFLTYSHDDTWIHRLCGATKLIFFILWSVLGMITYDTRVLLAMLIISMIAFYMSKIKYKQVSMVFKVICLFLIINILAIFIFSPYEGTKIYGTRHDLLHLFGKYTLTKEQIFYECNVALKYFTVIPAALLFIVTTNPSEFAASLNRLGVNYKIGYSISLAFRYIPDIQRDFNEIKQSQEARGIDMSKDVSLPTRVKSMGAILFPLIFSSMERIDVISNAMELRGFGKSKKRTWYTARPFTRMDYMVIIFTVVFSIISLVFTFYDGSRFYNPFM
ncbi:energy-coupling factor transporter transmembrane component T [Anaerocolumna aminovalerica]|uniref:Energy-coupling factor transport system permease protein n=1 Tax=Anaerocolumna aminovalerica TaxID=1527 RepID=A0A1I5EEG5_9FIRM|nr:energy-coupling factor transporter transmembrane component T [Anaerocolumna aminovalerica]SFO09988.1 energy-coupling factor transport system permease protein [Anaerocolumna aminovalerica]